MTRWRSRTLGHHGQVHHLADHGVVLVVGVEEGAVEEAAVGARVVEGDVEQVDGGVLDVAAPLASFPDDALQKLLVLDGGAVVVGVDLRGGGGGGGASLGAANICARLV